MKKIFSTPIYEMKDDEGNYCAEAAHVFTFESDDEAEDFAILSNTEQLNLCGFKEERTPSKGTVHRYYIDAGDMVVMVREAIFSW